MGFNTPSWSPPQKSTFSNRLALRPTLGKTKSNVNWKRKNKRGVAQTIREECERLFCETMKVVFLGEEGRHTNNGSNEMVVTGNVSTKNARCSYHGYSTRDTSYRNDFGTIDAHIEFWDYMGGCNFRGFVGGSDDSKGLFIFFDSSAARKDLKQG